MALIKCPECGKEVSDKAASCPNCGCPIVKYDFQSQSGESFNETGYTGKKGLVCPNTKCKSKNIEVFNDIPTAKKVSEIATFGTVSELTKSEFRDGMIYKCRDCGTIWNKDGILTEIPDSANKNKSPKFIPAIAAILSLVFFLFVIFAVISGDEGISGNLLQFLYALLGLTGTILCVLSIKNYNCSRIAEILFFFCAVLSAVLILRANTSFVFLIIPLIFLSLMEMHQSKCSKK